jgi:transposase
MAGIGPAPCRAVVAEDIRNLQRWTRHEEPRVARRNGVVRGLLTVWRHKLAAAAGANARDFVPVRIVSEGSPATAGEPGCVAAAHTELREMASPSGQFRGAIEIEVSGARIRVEPGVDAATLCTVLSVLRGGR